LNADIPVNFSGRLLGVGGHMHDYGEQLALSDETTKQPIATLNADHDTKGRILTVGLVIFPSGGFPLNKGGAISVKARYGKPRTPKAEGMAIVVGYFLPDHDAEMKSLERR
jgi:hypothetical protein